MNNLGVSICSENGRAWKNRPNLFQDRLLILFWCGQLRLGLINIVWDKLMTALVPTRCLRWS